MWEESGGVNRDHIDDSEGGGHYHHGTLREVLLEAAAAEIEARSVAGLSLRLLARRAGVSHAAPAHHFGDKRGLYTALAAQGFRMLHERTAPELALDPMTTGQRYIEFALAHPAHFAVMFDPALLDTENPDLVRERSIAFSVVDRALRATTGLTDAQDLARQTTVAWALVHGLAILWLSGNLPYPRDPSLVEEVLADLAPALPPSAEARPRSETVP
ncbi:MAG: TetR/AcrR family transcriptional regulator [Sporichthyaceae bacterium]